MGRAARPEVDDEEERRVLDGMTGEPTVIYVAAPGTSRFLFVSDNVEALLGVPARAFVDDGNFWIVQLHPDDRERVQAARSGTESPPDMEYRIRHGDGSWRWIRDSLKVVTDEEGHSLQRIGFWTGIAPPHDPGPGEKPAPPRLHNIARIWMESEDRRQIVRDMADVLPSLLYIYDLQEHRHIFVNKAYQMCLGYSADQIRVMGSEFLARTMHPDDLRRLMGASERYNTMTDGEVAEVEYRMRHANSEYRWLRARAVVLHKDARGIANQIIGVAEDVTERKRLEEQLVHTALYDTLTDLPNRALFLDRLERAMRRGKRQPQFRFAVLYLDLDRFKVINDGLGHLAGDQMLVFIARRLESCIREGDTFARLGGDEFAILMEGLQKEQDALQLAERMQGELRKPFLLGMHEVVTSASIGIAFSSPYYENPKEVVRDADIALYRAKEQGLGCSQIFDAAMHERMKRQIRLEEELRRALDRQEFEVYYQPVRSLSTGQLLGLEALVRWQHPKRGLLAPDEFLSATEETGLIVPLGWWVMYEACRQAAAWIAVGVLPPQAYLSVNVAGKQFAQIDMVERLASILDETGLAGSRLMLEMTETVILENPATVHEKLNRLKALGPGILLDDFGTGYSSLSRLIGLPIDGIKIDRSFIAALNLSESHRRLVRALIHLAHDLKLGVTAEGVQSGEQADLLRRLGCDAVQGLMFLPPLPAAGLEQAVADAR